MGSHNTTGDTMGEVDQDDVILIQEEGGNKELIKKTLVSSATKLPWMLLTGGFLIFTITVWTTTRFIYEEPSGPLLWVLVSLLMIFHGLIGVKKPPESYSLDLVINEKKFSWKIPLRHVLGATVNAIIGIAGVISITIIHYQWWYSTWEILGLILCSLLLLWVMISSFMIYSKQRSHMQLQNSKSPEAEALQKSVKMLQKSVEYLETSCGEYIGHLVQLFNSLLPLPTIQSLMNANLGEALKQQRKIIHKPVHIFLLLLAMIICVLMFSAQLWFVSTSCNLFYDCEVDGYFARTWTTYWAYWARIDDRILIILISTPVTFLLSTMLILLMKKTNVLRLLLIIIISSVLGLFVLVLSFSS